MPETRATVAALLILALVVWTAYELGRQRGAATAPDLAARVSLLEGRAAEAEARLGAVEQPRCLSIGTAERFDVTVYSTPGLGVRPLARSR